MTEIKLLLNDNQEGAFTLYEDGMRAGEMVISITGNDLTVYHTEVAPQYDGKGYARQLLEEMVAYVKAKHLMVIALCPYVLAQFRRHPDAYAPIWKNK